MTPGDITKLLQKHKDGDGKHLNEIYVSLYQEIKAIAGQQLKSLNPGQTITPTALANECYIKLAQLKHLPQTDKRHFMLYLAKSMRSYLIDSIRQKQSIKRKAQIANTGISQFVGDSDININMLDIERLLDMVETVDIKLAEVLQYKMIFNLTFKEIAGILDLSERHVIRLWNQSKALLLTLLETHESER